MPSLLIKEMTPELMTEMKHAALQRKMTLKEWVKTVLAKAVEKRKGD